MLPKTASCSSALWAVSPLMLTSAPTCIWEAADNGSLEARLRPANKCTVRTSVRLHHSGRAVRNRQDRDARCASKAQLDVGGAFQAFIGMALGQTYTGSVFDPYTHDQLLLFAAFIFEDVMVTAYQVRRHCLAGLFCRRRKEYAEPRAASPTCGSAKKQSRRLPCLAGSVDV